jgi:uncharacterized membrane protein
MPDTSLTSFQSSFFWFMFFATSVYGHLALKLAVNRAHGTAANEILWSGLSWWGASAYAAWGVSCICWMLVISRSDLLRAGSISSLSYVLLCASAVLFLGDAITLPRVVGAGLIAAGILLIK